MEHLIQGIEDAVEKESWYAALALALGLPDACAAIERPGPGISRQRYTEWANKYVRGVWSSNGIQFFTGAELYRLRCAYLHQGDFDLGGDRPVGDEMFSTLNIVRLFSHEVMPSRGYGSDSLGRQESYVVSVRELCGWICDAARQWRREADLIPEFKARIDGLSQIESLHDRIRPEMFPTVSQLMEMDQIGIWSDDDGVEDQLWRSLCDLIRTPVQAEALPDPVWVYFASHMLQQQVCSGGLRGAVRNIPEWFPLAEKAYQRLGLAPAAELIARTRKLMARDFYVGFAARMFGRLFAPFFARKFAKLDEEFDARGWWTREARLAYVRANRDAFRHVGPSMLAGTQPGK